MRKVTMLIVIILTVIIALGSVCGADDKKGYIVRSETDITDMPPNYTSPGITGEAYCNDNDYVTGCSYLLKAYPGSAKPSDYTFPVVQPIGCSTDKEGFRICTGCRVLMEGITNVTTEVLWVYAYCSRGKH